MYFLLSKLLLFLIFPITWILVLLFIAAFTGRKKLRKWAGISAVVLFLIFSNTWLCNRFCHAWEYPPTKLPDTAHYSCVIVLGGFSSQANATDGRFNSHADRFIQGIRLLSTGKVKRILISGGNGTLNPREFSEGKWVKEQLKQLNYPDSLILVEWKSRNTLENARFSAELLKQQHLPPPYLLVTSGFHMRRALMIFEHARVNVIPYACDYNTGESGPITFYDLIPEPEAIAWWDLTIKEEVGYRINSLMKNYKD